MSNQSKESLVDGLKDACDANTEMKSSSMTVGQWHLFMLNRYNMLHFFITSSSLNVPTTEAARRAQKTFRHSESLLVSNIRHAWQSTPPIPKVPDDRRSKARGSSPSRRKQCSFCTLTFPSLELLSTHCKEYHTFDVVKKVWFSSKSFSLFPPCVIVGYHYLSVQHIFRGQLIW